MCSRADRFSALGRCKTCRILQYSRTAKYDFAAKRACTADGTKFRFKFIRRYGANFIKFMRTAINFILKFLHRRACKHIRIAKHAVNAVILQNVPAQNTACQTARRTAHDPSVFGVRHGYSRCKSVAANDCNTPLLAFSARQTFHSCTRARASQSAATSPTCAVARRFIPARRDSKF